MATGDLLPWHEAFDRQERPSRVERHAAVLRWLEPYQGGVYGGGHEAEFAIEEAKAAYVYGLPMAGIFASHVACERVVASLFDLLVLTPSAAPKGWERMGLGALAREANLRDWLSDDLMAELIALADNRRVIGHFRRPLQPGTLLQRVFEMLPYEDTTKTTFQVLMSDAAKALRATFRLAFSRDEAFWRVGGPTL
jgi:hypothetical protein